jgi:hypothetical protein
MEAIKFNTDIKSDELIFKGLSKFKGKKAEVIIVIEDSENINIPHHKKSVLLKFDGNISSSYSDTSSNVDNLIYGK